MKSQIATSSWGGKRKLPYAFTEQTGRGIPQITSVYGRDDIRIEENNIVVTIPFDRLEDETYALVDTENASVKSENVPVDAPVKLKMCRRYAEAYC